MIRLAIKNLAQNKVRLLLTTFAIVLGVGFVVSSFVLRDGLKEIFNNLATEVVDGVDLSVSSFDPVNDSVGQDELDIILALDGVSEADLTITGVDAENLIQPIKPDGTTITLQGPPQIAFGWSDATWSASSIVDGRAPTTVNEWVIDPPSLAEHGFVVGDTYDVITPAGRRTAELVGTFTFDGFIEGPTFISMTNESLQDYLLYGDRFDSLIIVGDGSVPLDELNRTVTSAIGADIETSNFFVQTQADLIAETQGEFNQALDIIGGVLLGFALVSLFVSIFIISNTFAITTSQRTRELGLLRAIGATPRQILRSVVAESVVIGVIASVLGIGAGVLIALGLRAILNQVGVAIPDFSLVVAPATVLYAFVVGTAVTVLAAIVPAIGAARTSPIAAITGQSDEKKKSIIRFVVAAIITAIGLALMALGLFGNADGVTEVLVPLGIGAGLSFIGITLLSPLVAGPLSRIIGAPLSIPFGTAGHLAKENSARNPRRTATTAAALMIGLSLVSGASVLGESFKAEFENILNTAVQGDFLVTSDNEQSDIPDEVVAAIQANNAFGNTTAVKYTNVMLEEDLAQGVAVGEEINSRDVAAFDYANIDGLFNLSVVEGSLDDITTNTVGIRNTLADDLDIGLGDSIHIAPDDVTTGFVELAVVAIFEEAQVSGQLLLNFERFEEVAPLEANAWIAASVADGVDIETADAEFAALSTTYPNLAFQSSAEFRQTFSEQIDFILNLLTVLLGLTIFIALLGIANTLALSVFERTRELGLLRAVGMVRRQTRRMIRWEAVIISAVGAVLGTVLGVALGAIIVTAIPEQFLSAFAIPWTRIVIMVLAASFAGVFAALFPAWRASRMNVLSAINSE